MNNYKTARKELVVSIVDQIRNSDLSDADLIKFGLMVLGENEECLNNFSRLTNIDNNKLSIGDKVFFKLHHPPMELTIESIEYAGKSLEYIDWKQCNSSAVFTFSDYDLWAFGHQLSPNNSQ